MSSEQLRELAMMGSSDELWRIIQQRPNPCGADDCGLTALHYAAWNGNVECVKMLAFNPHGIDRDGNHVSSLKSVSSLGFTALHVAAMDCPAMLAREVIRTLLVAGCNTRALDFQGRTAEELSSTPEIREEFQRFSAAKRAGKDSVELREYRTLFTELRDQYGLKRQETGGMYSELLEQHGVKQIPEWVIDIETAVNSMALLKNTSGFAETAMVLDSSEMKPVKETVVPVVPGADGGRLRIPRLAAGSEMQLELVQHLVKSGFSELKGVNSLRALQFAEKEADHEAKRLAKIVEKGNNTTAPT